MMYRNPYSDPILKMLCDALDIIVRTDVHPRYLVRRTGDCGITMEPVYSTEAQSIQRRIMERQKEIQKKYDKKAIMQNEMSYQRTLKARYGSNKMRGPRDKA